MRRRGFITLLGGAAFRAIPATALALASLAVSLHAAHSQQVTFADLEGTTLTVETILDQLVEREEDRMKVSVKNTNVWNISVGANKAIDFTWEGTSRGPGGTRKAKWEGSFDLDEPRHIGGGEGVWTFAHSTLTWIRSYAEGAYRLNIAFARAPEGLTCTVTAGFARERGTGRVRLFSPYSKKWNVILSAKQVGSSCKVSRNTA